MIIGLSGYARSGKDTVGQILVEDHGFKRLAFADALKAVAYDSHPKLREIVDRSGWEGAKAFNNFRVLLQDLGVAVRQHVDPDAWVNAVLRQVGADDYVITDVRFPNEAEAVKAYGPDGFVVRVVRQGVSAVNAHVSETALDDWGFDDHVLNFGTLDALRVEVKSLLRGFTGA